VDLRQNERANMHKKLEKWIVKQSFKKRVVIFTTQQASLALAKETEREKKQVRR